MKHMVPALLDLEKSKAQRDKKITQAQFLDWKKGLVFDHLLGIKTGQSFCTKFHIVDYWVCHPSWSNDQLLEYLEDEYVK